MSRNIVAAFILLAGLAAVLAEQVSYNGYKVYQLVPTTKEQAEILKGLEDHEAFDFWTDVRSLNVPVDVMVAPAFQNTFQLITNMASMSSKVIIDNVQVKIIAERFTQAVAPRIGKGRISFTQYHRYSVIQDYLREQAASNPAASVETIRYTFENRPLDMIKLCKGGICGNNPGILVDCGIHAREWIAPATCLYIIQELLNPINANMIENTDWYIIPVLNPDGYEYSHTTARLWRKTRSRGTMCHGTDGNRNFDFHWMETGASSNECAETYAGKNAFSEEETSALRDFVNANKQNLHLYLTFHSYGQYLLYPWGYTSQLPADWPELDAVAQDVAAAIRAVAGTRYTIGSSTNVLYAAAGGSDDWVKGVGGVELSYTIELPGSSFELPASRIQAVVEETWEGVKVYQDYIAQKFGRK